MEKTEVVKRIGNYRDLVYKIMRDCYLNLFNLDKFLSYIRNEANEEFCSNVDNGEIVTTNIGKGFFGSVGEVKLCGVNSKDEEEFCATLQQLVTSYNNRGKFFVFAQPVVKKLLQLHNVKFDPNVIIDFNETPTIFNLQENFPNNRFIPERHMEMITSNIANVIYDSGQNPHVIKSFGSYSCGENLHIIMELADKGDLKKIIKEQLLEIDFLESIFIQGIMASFLLMKHAGILHIDTHLGNFFLEQLSTSEKGLAFYTGQDLYDKRYIHYTNLPREIFGFTNLIVEASNLVKLGDYGLVVTDLSKAQNEYLKCDVKFSSLGELSLNESKSLGEKMVARKKECGVTEDDLFSNIVRSYYDGVNTSSSLFYFLFNFIEALKNSPNKGSVPYFTDRINQILLSAEVDPNKVFRRHKSSRSGEGLFDKYIPLIFNSFGVDFPLSDGRLGHFIGNHTLVPRENYENFFTEHSLVVNWNGSFDDPIFKSLSSLRNYQKCEGQKDSCNEEFGRMIKFSPESSISDTFSLSMKKRLTYSNKADIILYRKFPSVSGDPYNYSSSTRSPDGSEWPISLENKRLRGIMIVQIKPQNSNIAFNCGLDLYSSVIQTREDGFSVNGGYFLVDANLNNALGNIQRGARSNDPLGINYINGVLYLNPFPPIYENWLTYVCINDDGKHLLFSQKDILSTEPEHIDLRFTYCIPREQTNLDDDILFTRKYVVPDLRKFAVRHGFKQIYQAGPILNRRNGTSFLKIDDYDRQFRITEDDLNNFVKLSTNSIAVESLLGKKYCVYAKNIRGEIKPDLGYYLFKRANSSIPTLYGMNHSHLFVNHNILLCYEDGSISFLLVSGRGYGSEGIDRAQLSELIAETKEFNKNLVASISLDGGFSANAIFKISKGKIFEYFYALDDPERRTVGMSYLFT